MHGKLRDSLPTLLQALVFMAAAYLGMRYLKSVVSTATFFAILVTPGVFLLTGFLLHGLKTGRAINFLLVPQREPPDRRLRLRGFVFRPERPVVYWMNQLYLLVIVTGASVLLYRISYLGLV